MSEAGAGRLRSRIRCEEVLDARPRGEDGFHVVLARGRTAAAKKLLLANGVVDRIPAISGIEPLYGRSVHHCPYCDAWEWRDRRLAVYGRGRGGVDLAHTLVTWSRDIVLLTDRGRITPAEAAELADRGIQVVPNRILRLEGNGGMLRSVVFQNREPLPRDALFFFRQETAELFDRGTVGLSDTSKDAVWTNRYAGTNVPCVRGGGRRVGSAIRDRGGGRGGEGGCRDQQGASRRGAGPGTHAPLQIATALGAPPVPNVAPPFAGNISYTPLPAAPAKSRSHRALFAPPPMAYVCNSPQAGQSLSQTQEAVIQI